MERARVILRYILAAFFVAIGVSHFTDVDFFRGIMPPYIPWHDAAIYVSGLCEILGGIGLLIPSLRRAAGYGLIALLFAVFPANVHMALNGISPPGMEAPQALLWLRLPFQGVFLAAVYFVALAGDRESGTL